jgi:hypothetical protein
MPLRPSFGSWSVLASVLAAAVTGLTVAGCSIGPLNAGQATPKTPTPRPVSTSAAVLGPILVPRPTQLQPPFVLEAVRIQAPARAGGCPAGSVALAADPGQCYRKVGRPVTIKVAGISVIQRLQLGPGKDAFVVSLSSSEEPALNAVTRAAFNAHGFLVISIAGRSWLLPSLAQLFGQLPQVAPPLNQTVFTVSLPRVAQTVLLQRMLSQAAGAPSG